MTLSCILSFSKQKYYIKSCTSDKRLVCHGRALDDLPIDRKLSSRCHLHHVTPLYQIHRHLLLSGIHKTQHKSTWITGYDIRIYKLI